jgi:predicted ATPase
MQALALNEQDANALEQAARRERSEMVESEPVLAGPNLPTGSLLPRPLTGLIGREREVAELLATLVRERVQLLTLTGPAGVGKTRLAIEVARRAQDGWSWDVAFINLTHVREPALVLPEITQALGLRFGDSTSPHEALIAALSQRELLLVLDNFEQVVVAAPQLVDLLSICSGLKVLVTSRIGLNVRGDREFPVAPLPLPAQEAFSTPEEIESAPAIVLFLERARAIRPEFALATVEEACLAAAICAHLDGLPLAIELAAARVRHMGLAELLRRLQSDAPLEALVSGPQDLPDYQRTMRSAIAWSYNLLTLEEQRVFRTLSVFAAGATVEGLVAVTEQDQREILTRAGALVNQNLVYVVHRNASTRYTQLLTLRSYGLEQLVEHGEMGFARRRHAEYYAALAKGERLLDARCDPESMRLIAEEYDNIRTALGWTLEVAEGPTVSDEAIWTGLRLAGALWFWWEVRGLLVEGLDWLERLVAVAPHAGNDDVRATLATVWTGVTALSYRLGRFERAYEAGECALALRRQIGDKKALTQALGNHGVVAVATLRFEVAEAHHREALNLCAEMGHPPMEFIALLNMGTLRRTQRRYSEALGFCRESLRIAERTEEYAEARAILWDNVGALHILLGEPAMALAALDRSEEIFRQLDSSWGIALCGHDLGRALLALDRLEEAGDQLARAIKLREDHGDDFGAARSRILLARVRLAQNNLHESSDLSKDALHALTMLKQTDALWTLIEVSGAAACARGQHEDAARLYAIAISQRDALWDTIDPQEHKHRARDLATVIAALGEERYSAISALGSAITLNEAVDLLTTLLANDEQ